MSSRAPATVARHLGWASAGLLYLASRAPLLPLGFGSDADAWTLATNAPALVFRGEYRISRAPGHPVHEILQSPFIALGGPLASNAFTLLLSGVLLVVVARLGRELDVARPHMAALALAVHPLVWIASADSTDFVLASLFAYSALLAGILDHPRWAGTLLGLAGGTRIETLAFILALLVFSKRIRWKETLGATALTAAVCYVPVAAWLRGSPWNPGDLATTALSPGLRAAIFVASAWTACGLVPLATACALLAASRDEVRRLVSARDPLLKATAGMMAAYVVITLVHPSKPTYYLPLLPLVALTLMRAASGLWTGLLAASLLSYALVYPDVVDRADGSLRAGFRWNNGLVVKDWVARWNAIRASEAIDRNSPPGPAVIVLGYWLPLWRYAHPTAPDLDSLAPGLPVDARTNAAFAGLDGAVLVHKLDHRSAKTLHARALTLAYGEGIDGFLQETYGYDIRKLSATEVGVRDLGPDVAERFTLPRLVGCAWRAGPWRQCVGSPAHSRASAR